MSVTCRNCGRPIVGVAETKSGYGWVHRSTRRERCPAKNVGTVRRAGWFAMPEVVA